MAAEESTSVDMVNTCTIGKMQLIWNGRSSPVFALLRPIVQVPSVERPFPAKRISVREEPIFYRCATSWRCDFRLRDYDLWLVLNGEGVLTLDEVEHEVRGPRALVFPPGMHVSGVHQPEHPFEVWVMHFLPTPARAEEWRWLVDHLLQTPTGIPARLVDLIGWHSELAGEDDRSAKESDAFAFLVLSHLWRSVMRPPPAQHEERLLHVLREIRLHPEKNWSLPVMAEKSALSRSHLHRCCRRLTGWSPAQYVIRQRVARAQLLFQETTMSVKEVAEACGYRDVFFFSRQFRQIAGRPPAQFASLVRGT
jgi:AraC family transcriptional regulator of arabinose operon